MKRLGGILMKAQQADSATCFVLVLRRQYNRLRSLLKEPLHECVLFCNEFQQQTYCPRERGEPQEKWQTR